MASIKAVLAGLEPPLEHEIYMKDGLLKLILIDPNVPAQVERSLSPHEYTDIIRFRLLVLYAVNEIRGKGSLAPLEVIPAIDWDAST
ncbi:hypothetical protein [Pseudomonas rhizosphaerae]|jgi:hypothetical protein|uniref:hypothetical protein n=1 Tax=Pseudomonas rhizosphaerae TaxID=216142 RepID=UPI00177C9312|nr:hypothetical protein [Pseudomonas rhizosphaerae]MBD8613760.1 hypothetical protein [Pseudomonas putida]MEB2870408.1 hypothetical protein [Pseudomonas rhizosphaerae]